MQLTNKNWIRVVVKTRTCLTNCIGHLIFFNEVSSMKLLPQDMKVT